MDVSEYKKDGYSLSLDALDHKQDMSWAPSRSRRPGETSRNGLVLRAQVEVEGRVEETETDLDGTS